MGKLREKMMVDLRLRELSPKTCKEYVRCAREFVAYHRRPAESMGEDEVRDFLMPIMPHIGEQTITRCHQPQFPRNMADRTEKAADFGVAGAG